MPELSAADAVKIDEQFAAAQLLFDNNGCNRCHSLDASEAAFAGGPPPNGPPPGPPPGDFGPGGPGPGGPPRGPNLSHIAQNPEHTQVWIADHIRDPKSHNPRSRMPSFEGKMTDEEINQIAEYLASLK
jgi:mono/diheme cytochrome c family protein